MNAEELPTTISATARTVIRHSGRTWYEADYLAAAAYLADLEGRLDGPVQVVVDGRELSVVERGFMVAVGRAEAGDLRMAVEVDGELREVLVTRDAMRVLWGANQDARSEAIVTAHRPFLERLARAKVADEDVGLDETIEITADDIEG